MSKFSLRPDLVIGLVGAAGTDMSAVKQQLKAQFASFDYEYEEIKLSQLIGGFCSILVAGVPEDERITRLMDGGDRIRRAHKGGDGVVCLAVTAMRKRRQDRDDGKAVQRPFVFVIDSLKNPEEVKTLNAVYGRNFYTISVYSSLEVRKTRLANRIAESCSTNVKDGHKNRAEKVIEEDQKREKSKLSQDVRSTFPKADFFIDAQNETDAHIKRFVELVFGEPFITPNLHEYAMFMAKAAAYRSCDLSRQVGAVIIGINGEIVSTGCNDVPYPQGGMFFEGREGIDNRDHTVEFDPNSNEISKAMHELISVLRGAKLMSDKLGNRSDEEVVSELLHGQWSDVTIDVRLRNLIEFGRVVHAEMHAITEAARLGRATQSATLYCTTFPCHICARHIIASGIGTVYFIEPYPKSLTKTLYKREIIADEVGGDIPGAVEFKPFQGVAPILYQRVFAYRPRKTKTGTIVHLNRSAAVPVGASFTIANPSLEESLSARVDEIREEIKVPPPADGG